MSKGNRGRSTAELYRAGVEHYGLNPARYVEPAAYPDGPELDAATYRAAIDHYGLNPARYAETLAYLETREVAAESSGDGAEEEARQ